MDQRQKLGGLATSGKSLDDFLLRIGGTNPFGGPMFRVVLAQNCLVLEGGEWHDWPEGASLQERGGMKQSNVGGMLILEEVPNQPTRIITEMRWTPQYAEQEGWVLQRWMPASYYGVREFWEAQTVVGYPNVSCLGPFPTQGGYEMCLEWTEDIGGGVSLVEPRWVNGQMVSAFTKEIPSQSSLQWAIEILTNQRFDPRELAATAAGRISIRLQQWNKREAKRRAAATDYRRQFMQDILSPLEGSSLEAGRLREEVAKNSGGRLKGHFGN